jgi:hypothetical protein
VVSRLWCRRPEVNPHVVTVTRELLFAEVEAAVLTFANSMPT